MTVSAIEARQALGRKASALIAGSGSAGERRALAFAHALADMPPVRPTFDDIIEAPAWLGFERAQQRNLARRAALVSMADTVAASIDGDWLTTLAKLAGEEAIDNAMAHAGTGPATAMTRVEADGLERRGLALLAASLPDPLRGLLAWADVEPSLNLDRQTAGMCVALAQERDR
jgi:hypothetical protein